MQKIIKSFLFLMLSLISSNIHAQKLTGVVFDKENQESVVHAHVYIEGSSLHTVTDLDGRFELEVSSIINLPLVISHLVYQTTIISNPFTSLPDTIFVTENENLLGEIVVQTGRYSRKQLLNAFRREFLGKSLGASSCVIENEGKIEIWFNTLTHILSASCDEPIVINNRYLGYRLFLTLERFEIEYPGRQLGIGTPLQVLFEGSIFFEDLEPSNKKIAQRREQIFTGSPSHFLRALANEQLKQYNNTDYILYQFDDEFILASTDCFIVNHYSGQKRVRVTPRLKSKELVLSTYHGRLFYGDIGVQRNNRAEISRIIFFTDTFSIDSWGNLSNPNDLLFMGYMGQFRIGDQLPADYGMAKIKPTEMSSSLASGKNIAPFFVTDFDAIDEHFDNQVSIYPQEKLHLHTDRDVYVPGEKIWFKAYVTDAHSHLHPTYSQYVYVELISPSDTLVHRVMILQEDGMFYGHLPILADVSEGDYTLRAYTRYMENLGDDYFFKKNIRIAGNGVAGHSTAPVINSPLSGELEGASFDVTFYPEGGNLVEGVFSKVAIKALNKSGYPSAVSGTLVDETGAEITSVKTLYAGMGVLGFQPEAGKKYYLKCTDETGHEKQFALPPASHNAYAITASANNNNLYVEIRQSVQTSDSSLYLLAHSRGEVIHFSEWEKDKKGYVFQMEQLPAGVIQLILFDGQLNPLSERLVFNKNNASEQIIFHTDKATYQIRDKIIATLSFPDSYPLPVGERWGGAETLAHFSIAITDDKDIAIDESTTILSSLLLSSELKGYIENPAYYLQDNPVANAALDLLMMTHGWRRYNIPEVVKGNPSYPQIPFQEFQTLTGSVKSSILSRPVADSEILVMMEDGVAGVTSTDRDGLFAVQDLEFPDSTKFYVQALSKKGSNNLQVFMDDEIFPELVYAPQSPLSKQKIKDTETKEESDMNAFIVKAAQRAKFDDDLWTILLEDVEVTAPRTIKDEPRIRFWENQYSDMAITRDDIEKNRLNNSSISKVLIHFIAGAREIGTNSYGKKVVIRGRVPLLVIDGVVQDSRDEGAWAISVNEIESFDVFRGASGVVFGMSGANGAISITTRRGENSPFTEKTNHVTYTPLGYQNPVEFYAPRYETLEARQSNIPDYRTTIFWKPDVVVSDEGKVSFEFYTSDFRTTYSVVIEGITADGSMVRQVEKIRVSD